MAPKYEVSIGKMPIFFSFLGPEIRINATKAIIKVQTSIFFSYVGYIVPYKIIKWPTQVLN